MSRRNFIAVFVLLGLSFDQQAQQQANDQSAVRKSTSDRTATIVFYRPKRFYGSGLTPSVYVNGEQVARLDNGRFFVLPVVPGNFKIESSMKHDPLDIDLAAGKVQYLEMVILSGNWRGGGRFIPTSSSDGRDAIKKLKPLDKHWVMSEQVTFLTPDEAGPTSK
jgi:hypothetical protein